MTLSNKPSLIRTIRCLNELDGYESEARKRGITADEMRALDAKRRELSK